jgi:hypothetical protein
MQLFSLYYTTNISFSSLELGFLTCSCSQVFKRIRILWTAARTGDQAFAMILPTQENITTEKYAE